VAGSFSGSGKGSAYECQAYQTGRPAATGEAAAQADESAAGAAATHGEPDAREGRWAPAMTASAAGVGRGGLLARTGLQTPALFELGDLRLPQEPEFASTLGLDLAGGGELAQPLMPDGEFVGGYGQQDQAVLPHGADSSAYPNSLPHRHLRLSKVTGRIVIGNTKYLGGSLRTVVPVKEETRWRTSTPPSHIKAYIFARDGYACRYCGASGDGVVLEPDHVTPNRLYGPDVCWNLVTACRPCNRNKGGHALDCWWSGKTCQKEPYGRLACR
jgi:hypothetical protein